MYSLRVNGTYYYYVTNLQGDVISIVDAEGNTVASYEYDPYGNILSEENIPANSIAAINPMRYRGYYYDTETEFYYLQSRYYDPEICRFLNADSLASTGQGILGNNMFAYCNNNPIMCTDHSGHWAVDWDLYHNQQAGKAFTEWYINTNENAVDENGNLTLDAKIKRTYQAINYDLELEAGFGVGIGEVKEVLDRGVAYTCYYDVLSVQYGDGSWDIGQRIVLSVYASALLPMEFGAGLDGFSKNKGPADGDMWIGHNHTQDSITIVSYANYNYFIGGNVRIGFDIINFAKTMDEIWG